MPCNLGATCGPFAATPAGLRVALRVQPGARRSGIDGSKALGDGSIVLALRVGAPAEGGKANAAAVKLLAKTWKVPKSAIEIVAGHGDRRKTVLIAGDAAALHTRLRAWLAGQPIRLSRRRRRMYGRGRRFWDGGRGAAPAHCGGFQ